MPVYAGRGALSDASVKVPAMHPDAVRAMMDDWSSLYRTESRNLADFCQKWLGPNGSESTDWRTSLSI